MEYGVVNAQYEPKVGQIVASRPRDFFTVEISNLGFKVKESSKRVNSEYITLLKYIGNGMFTEMYTDRTIIFAPIVDDCSENICTPFVKDNSFGTKYSVEANLTCVDFYQKCCSLEKAPLLMGNFFPLLDDEIYQLIGKQESERNRITSSINMMFYDATRCFQTQYLENFIRDFDMAVGEDTAYNFQHGISRKRVLKEDNEKNAE